MSTKPTPIPVAQNADVLFAVDDEDINPFRPIEIISTNPDFSFAGAKDHVVKTKERFDTEELEGIVKQARKMQEKLPMLFAAPAEDPDALVRPPELHCHIQSVVGSCRTRKRRAPTGQVRGTQLKKFVTEAFSPVDYHHVIGVLAALNKRLYGGRVS